MIPTHTPKSVIPLQAYIFRVARTIADLDYSATMTAEDAVTAPVLSRHIAEAIGYRALDRASYGQIF